jgi:peptidyl-prolyl cis-trans isomerase SurA
MRHARPLLLPALLAGLIAAPLAAGPARPAAAQTAAAQQAAGPAAHGQPGLTPSIGVPSAAALAPATRAADAAAQDAAIIVAIVNGDVISREDVNARRRLFALSTGLPMSPEILDRLAPHIARQLIDERLRLQEIQRRRIVVSDGEIAKAIGEIEARNGMQPGALRARLTQDGVTYRTLVDQTRVQLGWTRVLRQLVGDQTQVTEAEIAQRETILKAQIGQPQFHVAEIFIPVDQPQTSDEATKFAETVIQELHAGAPFAVVAAQFSQSPTALQGGDLGWVTAQQLDPDVLRVVQEMPVGAVANPIRVPGGIVIATLAGKRELGKDMATVLSIRQVFFPFAARLEPTNPTEQQKQMLAQAQKLSATATSCEAMEEASKAINSPRQVNPGDVVLEALPAPMRAVIDRQTVGKPSQPLVAVDGVMVLMVCSRDQREVGIPNKQEVANLILNERIERTSRTLMRDLQRRAVLDQRS